MARKPALPRFLLRASTVASVLGALLVAAAPPAAAVSAECSTGLDTSIPSPTAESGCHMEASSQARAAGLPIVFDPFRANGPLGCDSVYPVFERAWGWWQCPIYDVVQPYIEDHPLPVYMYNG